MNNTKKVKKEPALLYLGRFQADYFAEGATQSIRFPFHPEVVRDLEVVNPQALSEQIKAWVTQFNIAPATLTILLADDLLFSKTITLADPKSREDAIHTFIDAVPFEETSYVQVPFQGSVTVSVANKGYFDAFKEAFEILGFSVELILPAFFLNKEVNLAKSLDVASLTLALKKAGTYRQYSMLSQPLLTPATTSVQVTAKTPSEKKRLIVLVGVFGVLIVILIMVYAMSQNSNPVPAQTNTQPSLPPVAAEVPDPQAEMIDTMRIIYQPGMVDRVDEIIAGLQSAGVTEISSESATIATTSASVIFFAPTVSEGTRGVLLSEIQKIIPTLTVGEGDTASIDAVLHLN